MKIYTPELFFGSDNTDLVTAIALSVALMLLNLILLFSGDVRASSVDKLRFKLGNRQV